MTSGRKLEAHRLRLGGELGEDVGLGAVDLRTVLGRPDLDVVSGADEHDVGLESGEREERVLDADAVHRVDGEAAHEFADAARERRLRRVRERGVAKGLHAAVELGGAEDVEAARPVQMRERRHHIDLRRTPHALVPVRRDGEAALGVQLVVRAPEKRLDEGRIAGFARRGLDGRF